MQSDGLVEQILQRLAVLIHGRCDSGYPAAWPASPKARQSAGKISLSCREPGWLFPVPVFCSSE
jgi:hypothetical protein